METWRVFMVLKTEPKTSRSVSNGLTVTENTKRSLHYCATCDDRNMVFSKDIDDSATFVARQLACHNRRLTYPELRGHIQFPIPTVFRLDDGEDLVCGPIDVKSAWLFLNALHLHYRWYARYNALSPVYMA